MSNLFKIVHWIYPNIFATKEGFGIVVAPKSCGFKWYTLIIGYTNANGEDRQQNQEFPVYHTFKDFKEKDYVIKSWHYENKPCKVMIEGIRYAVYLSNKRKHIDNLSLIEILDKLNEYESQL